MGSGPWWPQRKWAKCFLSLFWESDPRREKVHPPPLSLFVSFFGVSPRDAERGLRKIPIIFEVGWDSSFSLRSWRTSFHPSALGWTQVHSPHRFQLWIHKFVHQRIVRLYARSVGADRNSWERVYPRPKSYSSSLRPNLRLAGPGIHGQIRLAWSNTGSDTCVQYALPDQGPEGACSWSHMAHHLGWGRLTLASPPRGPGKTPLGDEALSMGFHTETIVWTVLDHRLRRVCSVPQEILYTSLFWAAYHSHMALPFIQNTHSSQALTDPFTAPLPGALIVLCISDFWSFFNP